ncbi:hypothetical protein HK102_007291, partial [Quaeritorhiza haematococci]
MLKVVRRVSDHEIECEVLVGGELKSRKGINVPDVKLDIPALTEKDRVDAKYMYRMRLEYVALSFVQKPQDVRDLLDLFVECHHERERERQAKAAEKSAAATAPMTSESIMVASQQRAAAEAAAAARGPNPVVSPNLAASGGILDSSSEYSDEECENENGEQTHWRPHIIAKIEKPQALDDIDEIIKAADGIMVARGDLGVEVSLERVPVIQKTLIHRTNVAEKPVITATQMLESMINSPVPTRAEVSDVANAVFDGTDAVMLSGECAVGQYPVETVKMMGSICKAAESAGGAYLASRDLGAAYASNALQSRKKQISEFARPVADAAVAAAGQARATSLIVFTITGDMAMYVSKRRPGCSILAVTPSPYVYRRLSLLNGVFPVLSSAMRVKRSRRHSFPDMSDTNSDMGSPVDSLSVSSISLQGLGLVSTVANSPATDRDQAAKQAGQAAVRGSGAGAGPHGAGHGGAAVGHHHYQSMSHNTDSILAQAERDIIALGHATEELRNTTGSTTGTGGSGVAAIPHKLQRTPSKTSLITGGTTPTSPSLGAGAPTAATGGAGATTIPLPSDAIPRSRTLSASLADMQDLAAQTAELTSTAGAGSLGMGDVVVYCAGFHGPFPGLSNSIKLARFGQAIRSERSRGMWMEAMKAVAGNTKGTNG